MLLTLLFFIHTELHQSIRCSTFLTVPGFPDVLFNSSLFFLWHSEVELNGPSTAFLKAVFSSSENSRTTVFWQVTSCGCKEEVEWCHCLITTSMKTSTKQVIFSPLFSFLTLNMFSSWSKFYICKLSVNIFKPKSAQTHLSIEIYCHLSQSCFFYFSTQKQTKLILWKLRNKKHASNFSKSY